MQSIVFLLSIQILVQCQSLRLSERDVSTPLMFLHIPKNGGTAVAAYMKNNWSLNCAEAKLSDRGVTNAFMVNPEQNIQVSQIDANCYWMSIDDGPSELGRAMFTFLATYHGVRLRYGTGHLPFGYCKFIQSGCEYTTILREPLDRLISHYHYLKEQHPTHVNCQGCETLVGFLESLITRKKSYYGFDNMQARMLSGGAFNAVSSGNNFCKFGLNGCDIVPFMQINETHFQKAKENLLSHFPVIGILSDLKKYQALMYLRYNYQPYKIRTLRPTSIRQMSVEDLDEVTRKKMDELLHWDLKLYEFAKDLIQKRVNEQSRFKQALDYVLNFDPKLPAKSYRMLWNSSALYGGNLAKGLIPINKRT